MSWYLVFNYHIMLCLGLIITRTQMSKLEFAKKEISALKKNKYVVNVSETRITYSEEFKARFIREYLDGRKPTEIFRDAGFDVSILGSKRIERSSARWREMYLPDAVQKTKDTNREKSKEKRVSVVEDTISDLKTQMLESDRTAKAAQKVVEDLKREKERLEEIIKSLRIENERLKLSINK